MEAMGLKDLQEEISELQKAGGLPRLGLATRLKRARDYFAIRYAIMWSASLCSMQMSTVSSYAKSS